jgi:hypothetical protein
MKARLPLIAALAVAIAPVKAKAQAWVGNPNFSEGIGVRTGNLELHPSVGAEFGYDSNFLRASAGEGRVEVLKLRVTPSLTLSTLGAARRNATTPPDVTFAGSAYASYFELFPLDSQYDDVTSRRNVALGLDAKLDVYPKRKLGFDLGGGYVRVIEGEGATDNLTGEGFNRDTLRGATGLTWRPGGGLFEWRLGYGVTYNFFESAQYEELANLNHEIGTRGRWRFLPRSALLFDSTYSLVRYTNGGATPADGDSVRSRVGFHGLVTYHLALLGMVGWGSTFYKPTAALANPRQFDSLIANAEARWFIQARPGLEEKTATPGLSSIALGYARTFSNSYYGSFYQQDRGYLQFNTFLVGAVAAGLEFGVSRVAFPEVPPDGAAFEQLRLDARAFGEYRFTDTLAANLTVQYDQVNGPVVADENLDYKRWQAYLGVRWFL